MIEWFIVIVFKCLWECINSIKSTFAFLDYWDFGVVLFCFGNITAHVSWLSIPSTNHRTLYFETLKEKNVWL